MKRKLALLSILFLAFPLFSSATHLIGGQIYWERDSGNYFTFYLELYSSFKPGTANPPTIPQTIQFGGGPSITAYYHSQEKFAVTCATMDSIGVSTYKSSSIPITAPNSIVGYSLSWTSCCKSPFIDNLSNNSQPIEILTFMHAGAFVDYPNGEFCNPAKVTGMKELIFQTNESYHIPIAIKRNPQDSVFSYFGDKLWGTNPSFSTGYSLSQPLPGINQGEAYDPTINSNYLAISPTVAGNFSAHIVTETYINGQLASESVTTSLSVINHPNDPNNGPPKITFTGTSHNLTLLPPHPLTGDSIDYELIANASDTIIVDVAISDTLIDPKELQASINASNPQMVTIDSAGVDLFRVTIIPSLDPSFNPYTGRQYELVLFAEDGGCPPAGSSLKRIYLNILPMQGVSASAQICMVAYDTISNLHQVYFNAPENDNSSSLLLKVSEYNLSTNTWSTDTIVLLDKDTIFEHVPVYQPSTVAYELYFKDPNYYYEVRTDEIQAGTLPLNVVNTGLVNQIIIPWGVDRPPLWVKTYKKPLGSPASSFVAIDSIFHPTIQGMAISLWDTLSTASSFDYRVEAKLEFLCDTSEMNFKSIKYYDVLTSGMDYAAHISLEDLEKTHLAVYPNPVKNTIYWDGDIQTAELQSLGGKPLKTVTNSMSLEMTEFPNGLYILVLKTNRGEIFHKKIVKQ